ncbi:MAG TPA: DUF4397 domain-containing protein [Gemmatimonadaceae bacterium]
MRFTRLLLLGLIVGAAACDDDKVTTSSEGPHSDLRFISAIADTGAVDISFVDQIDASNQLGKNLAFRAGTAYQPVEAKARHIRVFPTSLNINATSQVLLDTTITIPAGQRITLLLVGPTKTAGQLKFVMIEDNAAAPAAGQINVRAVNASTGAISGFLVNAVGDAVTGTATFNNLASLAASPYVGRATGAAALRFTDVGTTTVRASQVGPNAPTAIPGAFPGAGIQSAGTNFSVYYFGGARAGSAALQAPAAVWFVDRNPCDDGCTI